MTTTFMTAARRSPGFDEAAGIGEEARALGLAGLLADPASSMTITPVIHPQNGVRDPKCLSYSSAVANALYIVRRNGCDLFGPLPDFTTKLADGNDVVASGRRGPIGCDADAVAGLKLWQAADEAARTDRPSAPVAFHAIGWLPTNATREAWLDTTLSFLDHQVVANGMVADWAIHALADPDGRWLRKPHLHAVLTHRFWRAGRRTGEPNPGSLGSTRMQQKMVAAWALATTPREPERPD